MEIFALKIAEGKENEIVYTNEQTDKVMISFVIFSKCIEERMRVYMDKIDAMLITLLQENARAPLKLLASKVFLSAPAVSSRIDKLEKQGIILGYNTIIDRQKLGYHITAFINLELSADQKSEFYPFISSCPNVLECNCITGVYSMLIKVAFPSTQELDTFIGKIQRFGNTSTQIVFSTPVPHREIIVEPNI